MKPHLQTNQSKMGWRCGSSVTVPALQAQSPEFKTKSHQKNLKMLKIISSAAYFIAYKIFS
jgi:hypothetical protein